MVHVSEVPRGLKANVCCPDCSGRMIARHRRVRRWHFAHYGCVSCEGMTWLHRTAQRVLVDQRRITVPDYEQSIGEKRLEFSEVHEEAAVGSRRVDCLCVMEDGYEIAVEIRVTHEVDEEKLADLRSANPHRDIIEIDLVSLRSSATNRQELIEAVCDSPQRIRWLFSAEPRRKSGQAIVDSIQPRDVELPPRQRRNAALDFVQTVQRSLRPPPEARCTNRRSSPHASVVSRNKPANRTGFGYDSVEKDAL